MIGVFDSGAGGLTAIAELRRLQPCCDVCFYADRANAPYGTKSRREIIRLVTRDIYKLLSAGADRILMACCTASTVYPYLPRDMREVAYPIIAPAAREAARSTENGKIGVIATRHTAACGAFKKEILRHGALSVTEICAQSLVSLVESGIKDGSMTEPARAELLNILTPIKTAGVDTLILGCTHFPHLKREIAGILPGVRLINPSREGAKEIIKTCPFRYGKGITVYLE